MMICLSLSSREYIALISSSSYLVVDLSKALLRWIAFEDICWNMLPMTKKALKILDPQEREIIKEKENERSHGTLLLVMLQNTFGLMNFFCEFVL